MIELYRELRRHVSGKDWWRAESPFEVAVGAVLTQQTRWTSVEEAIQRLKEQGPLTPHLISDLPEDRLQELIRCTGFYRQKARRLKRLSRLFLDHPDLLALPKDDLRERLLGVKGVGEETADSIILYAAGKPCFVIDAYTRRIMGCVGVDGGYARLQALFEETIPRDPALYREYHALFVEYGKEYCNKNRCEECSIPGGSILERFKI